MTCLKVTEITYQIRCRGTHRDLAAAFIFTAVLAWCNKKYLDTADSADHTKDVKQAMKLAVDCAAYNDVQPGLFFMLGTGNI